MPSLLLTAPDGTQHKLPIADGSSPEDLQRAADEFMSGYKVGPRAPKKITSSEKAVAERDVVDRPAATGRMARGPLGSLGRDVAPATATVNPEEAWQMYLRDDDPTEMMKYIQERGYEPVKQGKSLYFTDKAGKYYDPQDFGKIFNTLFTGARRVPEMAIQGVATAAGETLGSVLPAAGNYIGGVVGAGLGAGGAEVYDRLLKRLSGAPAPAKDSGLLEAMGTCSKVEAVMRPVFGTLGKVMSVGSGRGVALKGGAEAEDAQRQNILRIADDAVGSATKTRNSLVDNLNREIGAQSEIAREKTLDSLTLAAMKQDVNVPISKVRQANSSVLRTLKERVDDVKNAYWRSISEMHGDFQPRFEQALAPVRDNQVNVNFKPELDQIIQEVSNPAPNVSIKLDKQTNKILDEVSKLGTGKPSGPATASQKEAMFAAMKAGKKATQSTTVADLVTMRSKLLEQLRKTGRSYDRLALNGAVELVDDAFEKQAGLGAKELTDLRKLRGDYRYYKTTLDQHLTNSVNGASNPIEVMDALLTSNSRKHPEAAKLLLEYAQKSDPALIESYRGALAEKLITEGTTPAKMMKAVDGIDPKVLEMVYGKGPAARLRSWIDAPRQLEDKTRQMQKLLETPEGLQAYEQGQQDAMNSKKWRLAGKSVDAARDAVTQAPSDAQALQEALHNVLTPEAARDIAAMQKMQDVNSVMGYAKHRMTFDLAIFLMAGGQHTFFAHTPALLPIAATYLASSAGFKAAMSRPEWAHAYMNMIRSPKWTSAHQMGRTLSSFATSRAEIEAAQKKQNEQQAALQPAQPSKLEQFVTQTASARHPDSSMSEVRETRSKIDQELSSSPNSNALQKAVDSKKLKIHDATESLRNTTRTPMQQRLQEMNLEQLIQAAQVATPEEKQELTPILQKKYQSTISMYPPQKRQQIMQQVGQLLGQGVR